MEKESLNYEDYFYEVWDCISEIEIPEQAYYVNSEKFQELTFKLHRLYSMGENLSPSLAAKLVVLAYSFNKIN